MSRNLLTKDNNKLFADHVRTALQNNSACRRASGDENRILRAKKIRIGEYSDVELSRYGKGAPYLNIIERKAFDFESLFSDMQFNVLEKPWTLRPALIPDLPMTMKRTIAIQLLNEFGPGFANSPDAATRYYVLKKGKILGMNKVESEAEETAKTVDKVVHRHMMEAGWTNHYEELINDIATYPNAITKGPFITMERRGVWDGDDSKQAYVPRAKITRVAPPDFYPSGDGATTQTVSNLCEVLHIDSKWINAAHKLEGFDKAALTEVTRKWMENPTDYATKDAVFEDACGSVYEQAFAEPATHNTLFGVEYWGGCSGMYLKEKLGVKRGINNNEHYEMRIIVVQDKCVYARTNEMPDHMRPYHSSSYRMYNDCFWGRSIGDLLFDMQQMMLGLTRAHQRNAAMAAEPIYEIDNTRFSRRDRPNGVWPGMRVHPKADPLMNGRKAITMEHIPDNTTTLRSALLDFYKLSDDLVGIPSFVTQQPSGSVGRVGAVYVQAVSNALKGIRKVGQNIDKGSVEPCVQLMYKLIRDYTNDISTKYDMEVEVSGIAGLVQREIIGQNDEYLLQVLQTARQSGDIPPAVVQRFLKRYFDKLGFKNIPELPDFDAQDDLAAIQGAATGLGNFDPNPPSVQGPGTQAVELDGRSPQIQNVQTPPGAAAVPQGPGVPNLLG